MRRRHRLTTLTIPIVLFAAALGAGEIPLTPRAQEERVYVGTVAGQPAVVELTFSESEILRGRFFYRRFGHDIVLEPDSDAKRFLECGSFEGGNYVLRKEPCVPTGIWDVTVNPETIRGRWHSDSNDPKAKEHSKPILLTRVKDSSDGAYERLRLSDNRFREVETKFAGNVAWRIVREDRSGVQRPLLILAPDPLAMSCINAALEKELHDEILVRLEDQASRSEVSVVFANERLFSVTSEDTVWGGAHPSNGVGARTFDLRTGDEVRWNEVLRLKDDGASASRLDLRREDLIAADVLREAVRLQALEDGGDCFSEVAVYYACERDTCSLAAPALEPEYWTFHPTEKGLAVAVDIYPEAGRGCRGEVVVVPWGLARKALRRPMPLP